MDYHLVIELNLLLQQVAMLLEVTSSFWVFWFLSNCDHPSLTSARYNWVKDMLCDSCGHANDANSEYCSLCHYSWVQNKHIQIEGKSQQVNGYEVKDKGEQDDNDQYFKDKPIKSKRRMCRKKLLYPILIILCLSLGSFLIYLGILRGDQLRRENNEETFCKITKSWVDECDYDSDTDSEVCYAKYSYNVNLTKTENNGMDYKCESYDPNKQGIYCQDDECDNCNQDAGYEVDQVVTCWIDCNDYGCRLKDPMSQYWQSALSLIIGIMFVVIPLCITLCCIVYNPLQRLMTK